jgi:hypothetical protein
MMRVSCRQVSTTALATLATAPPSRPRRHREDGVLGQELAKGVDVASPPGLDVRIDQLADALVPERAERRLLTPFRQALPDGAASSLESAVHRRDCRVERLRHLPRREAEHLTQEEHRALRRRQVLKRRHEGELHALALLVAGVGRRVALGQGKRLVREGLDPHGLDQRPTDLDPRIA